MLDCCDFEEIMLVSDKSCDYQSWKSPCSISMSGLSSGKTECGWWATILLWRREDVSEKASVRKVFFGDLFLHARYFNVLK